MEYERCVKIVFQLSGLQNLKRFFSHLTFLLLCSYPFFYLTYADVRNTILAAAV